jgi:hypothetical protein
MAIRIGFYAPPGCPQNLAIGRYAVVLALQWQFFRTACIDIIQGKREKH